MLKERGAPKTLNNHTFKINMVLWEIMRDILFISSVSQILIAVTDLLLIGVAKRKLPYTCIQPLPIQFIVFVQIDLATTYFKTLFNSHPQ
jgi:hypothetical protein